MSIIKRSTSERAERGDNGMTNPNPTGLTSKERGSSAAQVLLAGLLQGIGVRTGDKRLKNAGNELENAAREKIVDGNIHNPSSLIEKTGL